MFFFVSHCQGNLPQTELRNLVRLIGNHSEEAKPFMPVVRAEYKKRSLTGKVMAFDYTPETNQEQLGEVLYHLTGRDGEGEVSITMLGKFEPAETTGELESALAYANTGHKFSSFVNHNGDTLAVCEACLQMGRNTEIRFRPGSVTIPVLKCRYADTQAA